MEKYEKSRNEIKIDIYGLSSKDHNERFIEVYTKIGQVWHAMRPTINRQDRKTSLYWL